MYTHYALSFQCSPSCPLPCRRLRHQEHIINIIVVYVSVHTGICSIHTYYAYIRYSYIRPVRLLRVWISEGLTQADS